MTALSWEMMELLVHSSSQLDLRPTEITLFTILALYHVYHTYITHIYNVYAIYITHKYNLYAMFIIYTGIHIYEPRARRPEFPSILSASL